jgi:hypothetical protein
MARHKIPSDKAHGRQRALDVILSAENEQKFEVTPADVVPADLPKTYQGFSITWFSNFRVTKKAGQAKPRQAVKVQYTVEFDKVSGDKKYLDYDPTTKAITELRTRPVSNKPNRLQADLSVDDPPIGKV